MESIAECTSFDLPSCEQYPDWSKLEVSTGVIDFIYLMNLDYIGGM